MTYSEDIILSRLADAWNMAVLEMQRDPTVEDLNEFRLAIHGAQRIVICRAAARLLVEKADLSGE